MNESLEIRGICRKIDENPTDKLLWSILGDALEETGDPRFEGMRWLIENRKHPAEFGPYSNSKKFYSWMVNDYDKERFNLPKKIWNRLENYNPSNNIVWRDYLTFPQHYLQQRKLTFSETK